MVESRMSCYLVIQRGCINKKKYYLDQHCTLNQLKILGVVIVDKIWMIHPLWIISGETRVFMVIVRTIDHILDRLHVCHKTVNGRENNYNKNKDLVYTIIKQRFNIKHKLVPINDPQNLTCRKCTTMQSSKR